MEVSLITTSAGDPLSRPQANCLLTFTDGALSGRRVAIIRTATHSLSLTWADRPYRAWSLPVTIVTTAADRVFDAVILNDSTIVVAYIQDTTGDVMTVTVQWNGSAWQVGSSVTAFTGDNNFDPSIATDAAGDLWLTWTRLGSPPVRHVHVKSSTDSGATWGSGPTDNGDILHSGGLTATSALAASAARIFVVTYDDQQLLAVRSRAVADIAWSNAVVAASGEETSVTFALAARADGLLAIVYGVTRLIYREFDGVNFNPAVTVYEAPVQSPSVWWQGDSPVVAFIEAAGGDQAYLKYLDRRTGTFGDSSLLDARNSVFEAVRSYNAAAGTFEDRTTESQTIAVGDVRHSESEALIDRRGDALYCGLDLPYRNLHLILSTPGAGGALSFSYWDGSRWIAFTPVEGAVGLDQAETTLVLWEDYNSIPADWQKVSVDGESQFWIKVEALTDFTTAPVGSMCNALADVDAFRVGR